MERTVLPGALQRFQSTMDLFFQAVRVQALDRRAGHVPDLESYIALRRDTSGCKPCWALIEYANGLQIPDEVMEHPSIVALGEATNDLVTWSNVCKFPFVHQTRPPLGCTGILTSLWLIANVMILYLGRILIQCRTGSGGHTQHDCCGDGRAGT